MQDPTTGEMVAVTPEQGEQAQNKGICVLAVGEIVNINNTDLKVHTFRKKHVLLEFTDDNPIKPFKLGEKLTIKNGSFNVEGYGVKFLTLSSLPSTHTINQTVVDEYRKAQIKELRK